MRYQNNREPNEDERLRGRRATPANQGL